MHSENELSIENVLQFFNKFHNFEVYFNNKKRGIYLKISLTTLIFL